MASPHLNNSLAIIKPVPSAPAPAAALTTLDGGAAARFCELDVEVDGLGAGNGARARASPRPGEGCFKQGTTRTVIDVVIDPPVIFVVLDTVTVLPLIEMLLPLCECPNIGPLCPTLAK